MNVTYFESMYWISLETSDLTAFAGTDIDFDILKPYWQFFCKKNEFFVALIHQIIQKNV